MTAPTEKQIARMQWGFKLVGQDLCTDDHQGGRYRYHLGQWAEASGPFTTTRVCPSAPGDGLCVALTLAGAQSGGARLSDSVMLTVGYLTADVLAGGAHKVRVKRLYVGPDPVDPVALLPWAAATGANLAGANLAGANLPPKKLNAAVVRLLNDLTTGGALVEQRRRPRPTYELEWHDDDFDDSAEDVL